MNLAFLVSRRTKAIGIATLIMALPAFSANALGGLGDIVYDPSNFAQAVKQVQAWEQQYQQMREGLAKAEATYNQVKANVDAITGVRGLGDLFNNPLLKSVVPADLSKALADLNATGRLSGNAATIRSSTMVYDCEDLTEEGARIACQALLAQNAQAQATQQDTMALLDERTAQIDQLRSAINTTQDPKAIAELQARIAAEQAQVGNDQNKILLANSMLMTNRMAAAQAQAERVNALMATNKKSALDGFSFTNLGFAKSAQVANIEQ